MLNICEEFSSSHSMLFSTDPIPAKSKTKCLFFSRKRSSDVIQNVTLNGDSLPWIASVKHLGNQLSSKLDLSSFSPETKTDILSKRAILYDKVHQVLQRFGYYEPRVLINLISIYSTALYGSTLWIIDGEEHLKLNRSWNTAVKIVWDLPHPNHTRFLESLSPVPHLESILAGRYMGFVSSLSESVKPFINLLFNSYCCDLTTRTGQNIKYFLQKYSVENFTNLRTEQNIIKKARVYPVSETEEWKLNLIEELSLVSRGQLDLDEDFDENMLEEIKGYICTE